MNATAQQKEPAQEMSTAELQNELDELSDRLYNEEFTKSDLQLAQDILSEMKRRGLELPGEKIGVGFSM